MIRRYAEIISAEYGFRRTVTEGIIEGIDYGRHSNWEHEKEKEMWKLHSQLENIYCKADEKRLKGIN